METQRKSVRRYKTGSVSVTRCWVPPATHIHNHSKDSHRESEGRLEEVSIDFSYYEFLSNTMYRQSLHNITRITYWKWKHRRWACTLADACVLVIYASSPALVKLGTGPSSWIPFQRKWVPIKHDWKERSVNKNNHNGILTHFPLFELVAHTTAFVSVVVKRNFYWSFMHSLIKLL